MAIYGLTSISYEELFRFRNCCGNLTRGAEPS